MVAVCCAVYDQHFHGTFWVGIAPHYLEKLVGYHSRKLNLSQDCHWMSGCFHWWIFRDRLDVSDWLQSDIIQLIELASRYRGCHEPLTAVVLLSRSEMNSGIFAICKMSRLYPAYYLN